jgi:hypothetical protein
MTQFKLIIPNLKYCQKEFIFTQLFNTPCRSKLTCITFFYQNEIRIQNIYAYQEIHDTI